jgi:hypothetical protein
MLVKQNVEECTIDLTTIIDDDNLGKAKIYREWSYNYSSCPNIIQQNLFANVRL